jgi:hypothetical protein
MKKTIAALITFAAIAFPLGAIAQVASRDSSNNIVVSQTGLTPGTIVKIYYPGVLTTKTFTTSGACNLLTITSSASFKFNAFIKVNGFQIDLDGSIPPQLTGLPCFNGAPNPAYPWITAGSYKYVQSYPNGDKIFLTGASGSVEVSTDFPKFRLGKVDACGRISIKNSTKWDSEKLNLGNGTFSYIANGSYGPDIPIPNSSSNALPICRKGILYRPV